MSEIPECPFKWDPEEDIFTFDVPEHLRAQLAELWKRRARINKLPLSPEVENIGWYNAAKPIYDAFDALEEELRVIADAPKASCVDYYRNWKFRCPDRNTLRAEYLNRGGKVHETPEEKVGRPSPGRTWHEPEVGHLCFNSFRRPMSCRMSATLEQVLGRTRAKKKRPVA